MFDPSARRFPPGIGHVGAYQVSAVPYLTSSLTIPELGTDPLEVSFDRVTRFITVRNNLPTGSINVPLRVGFSSIGVSGSNPGKNNYFVLDNGESYTGDWKVSKVYLLSDDATTGCTGSVIAGLTSVTGSEINEGQFPNWSGSLGVG